MEPAPDSDLRLTARPESDVTEEAPIMNFARLLSSVALVGAMGACAAPAMGEQPSLNVGDPFPQLFLPSLDDGRPMSIADFRGERVVLHVFASW